VKEVLMGDYQEVVLTISSDCASLMEERGILDDDVKQVIYKAEATGEKLYQPDGDHFLSKMVTENATFYVEYSIADQAYTVHTAYSHRSQIMEE